jgi:2,3-bisphosphoglycerate-independent phosphoglycerate mutase
MRRAGLAAVGYFYVDFNDHTKQDARGLLSSLLDQLSTQSNPYFDILSGFHARHNQGGERPSETALSKCLKEMLEYPEQAPVFIVVDALDECPGSSSRSSRSRTVVPTPRQLVLKVLKGLIELKLESLHLCVTSRHEVDIQDELNSFKSEPLPVSLYDQRGQLDDIAQYVESVVASDVTMRGWPKRIQRSVVNTLTNESHGM